MAEAAVSFLLQEVTKQILGTEATQKVQTKAIQLMSDIRDITEIYFYDTAKKLEAKQLREMDLEKHLKEVVYVVEETIQSSVIQKAAAEAANICFRPFLIAGHIEALERAIESIRSRRLVPITRRMKAYGYLGSNQTRLTETNKVPSEQLYKEVPPPAPKKFVGFEDEAETIISSLLEETERFDIIAITGMPGIGKTTLASKIYHDNRIRDEFPTRIWLDVLRVGREDIYFDIRMQFNKQVIIGLQKLKTSLHIPHYSCLTIDAIRAYLQESRYLLVMDGVWGSQYFNIVKDMLPEEGKVLITSHYNIRPYRTHVLRFLNEKESWELLQLEVFGEIDKCPQTLKSIGESIARMCDGLPLAIEVAGSSLVVGSSTKAVNNLTKKWWEAVSENVTMYLTDYGAQHQAFESVELSYIKMHPDLRECFLYLGVFPEGHEIHVRTLARLWIAEGLVRDKELLEESRKEILGEKYQELPREWKSLEEIAYQCLDDLIERNLVMVVKRYANGEIKTCRLHKLIYAFCKYKAAEKDFYQEIKVTGDRPISLKPNCHRLCIYSDLPKFLSSKPKERHVRSILCFKEEEKVALSHKKSSRIHKWFKLLRVLECRHVNFTRFPNWLNKLIHLRYISLSGDEIRVIPETITSLRYLETLVVDTQSSSLRLKANIWRMFQLRHLVTKAAIVLAIRGEGEAGKNLQTLTRLAPECCTENVFKRTPNLKKLGVRGHLAALAEPESLRELYHLENLKLMNESAADCQKHLNCFPPKLKMLTLSGTYLRWECMSILGMIDGLEILKLKDNAFIGESWTSTGSDGFARLEFLLIGTTDLVYWEASDDCFPVLDCLVLNNCEKLQMIPSALAKSLDTLDVKNVSQSAYESAREIEHKIARGREKQKEGCMNSRFPFVYM